MKQTTKRVAIGGATLMATVAAAAGAYYLYGSKNAAQNRRTVASWMQKAEREIVREAKKLKNAAYSDATIKGIITEVAKRYTATKDIAPEDVQRFVSAVYARWKETGKSIKTRGTRKTAQKAAKRTAGRKPRARRS